MGEDKSDKSHRKVGKSGVSQISSCPKLPLKSGDSTEKPSVPNNFSRVFDAEFRQQLSEAVEKLKYESCGVPNCPNYVPETPMSPLEGGIESAYEVKSSDSNEVFFKKVKFLVENLKRQPCGTANCPKSKEKGGSSDVVNVVGNPESGKSDIVGNAELGKSDFVDGDEVEEGSGSALDNVDRDVGRRCGLSKRPKITHDVNSNGPILPESKTARDKADSSDVENVVGNPQSSKCDSEVKENSCSALDSVPSKRPKITHDVNSNNEVTARSDSVLGSVDQDKGHVSPNVVVVSDDVPVQDGVVSNSVVAKEQKTFERSCVEDEKACQSKNTKAALSNVLKNDGNLCDLTVEDVRIDGRSQSVVSSGMAKPVDWKVVKCTALDREGSNSCSDAGLDLLKSCSCSFCTKAGYIWSDLHYQDVKDRMSILTKSQKEAINLAQRVSCDNATGSHQLGDFSEATRLVIDLKNQWKSLFLNMENVFVDERNQLQTNFLALKDLRDEFKTNLESING